MHKLRIATIWLDGCSDCPMTLVDITKWLFEIAEQVDLVYSSKVDGKAFPERVDIALVEGAVASARHLRLIEQARERSRLLICFGDCLVGRGWAIGHTSPEAPATLLEHMYRSGSISSTISGQPLHGQLSREPSHLPRQPDQPLPVYTVAPVDLYLPGCSPPAARIWAVLQPALGVHPAVAPTRYARRGIT